MKMTLSRERLYLTVFPILACVSIFVSSETQNEILCPGNEQCPGKRPRNSNGCCPVQPWSQCDQEPSMQCDVALGYSCIDGICSGRMKLIAATIERRQVTLTWRNFMLDYPDYQHEYSVQYSSQYTGNTTEWSRIEVGRRSSVILKGLTPATWYFVRVGIWDDPLLQTCSVFSEITMFKTKDAENCDYNGRKVDVGESVLIECEDKCICDPTGQFRCNLVCPTSDSSLPQCTEESETGDPCCFVVDQCEPGCVYGDRFIEEGYSWQIGCDENCTCIAGDVICVPVCQYLSPPEYCSEPVLLRNESDCCGSWSCDSHASVCDDSSSLHLKGKCDICSCSDLGEEECSPLTDCDPVTVPRKSTVCPKPNIIHEACCPHIVCNKNLQENENFLTLFTVYSLQMYSMTVQIQLSRDKLIQGNITLYYTQHVNNTDSNSWSKLKFSTNYTHSVSNVEGESPIKTLINQEEVITMGDNFFVTVKGLQPGTFYYVKLSYPPQSTDRLSSVAISQTISVKTKGSSVPFERKDVSLKVLNKTSTSAVLYWSIPKSIHLQPPYLMIKYQSLDAGQWLFTDRLNSTQTTVHLEHLNHSTVYQGVLCIAYNGSTPGSAIKTTVFRTDRGSDKTKIVNEIDILSVQLSVSCAVLRWRPFRRKYFDTIAVLEVFWVEPSVDNITHNAIVQTNATEYSIQNLKQDTFYVTWLGLLFRDGTRVFSSKIHFMTKHLPEPSHPEYQRNVWVAAVVSTASILIAIIIIISLIYVIRCRWRRHQYQTHTSFENKIFQIRCDKEDDSL